MHDLQPLLKQFMTDALPHKIKKSKEEVLDNARATIHVPDIVFKDALYQIVDYYPGKAGSGRWFSVRMGIIGRAWRLNASQGLGNAAHSEEQLIMEWGMTDEEARYHSRQKPAYLCVLLKDKVTNIPSGLIYVDSDKVDFFGKDASKVALSLEHHAIVQRITEGVASAMSSMRKSELDIAVPL